MGVVGTLCIDLLPVWCFVREDSQVVSGAVVFSDAGIGVSCWYRINFEVGVGLMRNRGLDAGLT